MRMPRRLVRALLTVLTSLSIASFLIVFTHTLVESPLDTNLAFGAQEITADRPSVNSEVQSDTKPKLSSTSLATTTVKGTTTANLPIINEHNYTLIINQPLICSQQRTDVFVLAIVHTAPGNLKRRMVIRETWGSQAYYDKVKTVTIFAMGSSLDPKIQSMVQMEASQYGDIIQEDFIDSYKNLTLKGIMWLRWTSTYCPQALYVLKVDDDIFVNIFNLVAHISTVYKRNVARDKTILCLVWTKMKVMRDPKSKWYISKDDWAEDYFSRYCSGSAYIITRDLISPMYETSRRTKFFWVDDFYITGLLPRSLSASYVSLASLYVLKKPELHEKLVDGYAIFGHIPGSMNQRYSLWNEVLESRGLPRSHIGIGHDESHPRT